MAIFVLVHGGWHGGWCWKKLTPILRAGGHEVFTPTLTGVGERAHLGSRDIDMSTHIQDIVAVIEYEDLENVILVGHSYSGMVVTGASEKIAHRLSHLVLLDAFVPEDGQALKDIVPDLYQALKVSSDLEGEGWMIPAPKDATFGITDVADLKWMQSKLTTSSSLKTLEEPIRLINPAALVLPRTYILCHENGNESWFTQFAKLDTSKEWVIHELATGHDAMITAPNELGRILLDLAEQKNGL